MTAFRPPLLMYEGFQKITEISDRKKVTNLCANPYNDLSFHSRPNFDILKRFVEDIKSIG